MFNILNYSCSLLLFVLVSTIIYNYMNKEGFEIKQPSVLPKDIDTDGSEDNKYHIIPYFTSENLYSHYYVYNGSSAVKKKGIYIKDNKDNKDNPVFNITSSSNDDIQKIVIDKVYSRTYYNTDGENTTLIHLKDTSNKKSAIIKIKKDQTPIPIILDVGSSDDNIIHMAYDTIDDRVIIINPDHNPTNTKTLKIDIYDKDSKTITLPPYNTDSQIDTIYDIYCFGQFLYVLAKATGKTVIYKINISDKSANKGTVSIHLSSVFNSDSDNIKNMHMLVDKTNIYIINRKGKFYMFNNKKNGTQNPILNTKGSLLLDFDVTKELAHAKIDKRELYYIYRKIVDETSDTFS